MMNLYFFNKLLSYLGLRPSSFVFCIVGGLFLMAMPDEVLAQEKGYKLPNINLSHWKVTLPIENPKKVEPPEILEYATNKALMPFMYNDSTDGSLVFYTYPGGTTKNTKYSRTELREQMDPGNYKKNWTFTEGGRMKGTIQMDDISKDANGKYHKTIIMQIHGRLSDEQKQLIGKDDNDAPPILKIYWQKGGIRVKTKVLRKKKVSDKDVLKKDMWIDDEGKYFKQLVGFEPFTLEVIASEGRLEVVLNGNESLVYESKDMERWSVFENYFKAGNYLGTRDEGAFAKVKFFDLTVEH
ncbi:MAG: polysaccharide lyase family 7 protein [Reichenbachiella sp.]